MLLSLSATVHLSLGRWRDCREGCRPAYFSRMTRGVEAEGVRGAFLPKPSEMRTNTHPPTRIPYFKQICPPVRNLLVWVQRPA